MGYGMLRNRRPGAMDRLERCKKIVNAIDNLGQTEIYELFKLLHKNKCSYTRNNHGIFVNLAWLSDDMVNRIDNHIQFCIESQSEIRRMETICDSIAKEQASTTVHEPNAPKRENVYIPNHGGGVSKANVNTSSSTMKFYLLKKKYAKLNPPATGLKDELSYDTYAA